MDPRVREYYEDIAKEYAEPDTKKREPGCRCHWEEGDSDCPVHNEPRGEEDK